MPDNVFKLFKIACRKSPDDVYPIGDTLKDADHFFNLRTKASLLAFIANNGLENITHVNTATWKKSTVQDVYAFHFKSGGIAGYIAIINPKQTTNWLIKSFHPPKDRSTPMIDAWTKALDHKS